MAKLSQVDRLIKTSATPIHLVRCTDKMGRECHYFVMATVQKIRSMDKVGNGIIDISNYGQIIISGFGPDPSEETKAILKEKYGFDADSLN